MNTLQPYIIITTYPYTYLYIQHINLWSSSLVSNIRGEPHTWVPLWGSPLMWVRAWIEQESNTNQNRQTFQDNLLHHFDRSKKSFDWSNILNFKFHLENSRTWIFTLFILQMNILQPYIIITIYPYIYLYIQHIYLGAVLWALT